MARTTITLAAAPRGGYTLTATGRYGGGATLHAATPEAAAGLLRQSIARYLDTNPEGGDYYAPPEVMAALEANTVETGPGKGERLSYYASAAALVAIQSERESTGTSQSGAINALVIRGSTIVEDQP